MITQPVSSAPTNRGYLPPLERVVLARTNERTNATDEHYQDQRKQLSVFNAAEPVEYVEMVSDHAFTEFLASLSRVETMRERRAPFTRKEMQNAGYLDRKENPAPHLVHRAVMTSQQALLAQRQEQLAIRIYDTLSPIEQQAWFRGRTARIETDPAPSHPERVPQGDKGAYVNSGRTPGLSLTEEQMLRVRLLSAEGLSSNRVAELVGCSSRTVARARQQLREADAA